MTKSQRIVKKVNNYLFDHQPLKNTLEYTTGIFTAALSAFLFAFGYCAFVVAGADKGLTFVTGGVSGISQNIILILDMAGMDSGMNNYLQSAFYFAINIPLLIFSFLKIGRRFSIFTLVNVGLSSAFISLLTTYNSSFVGQIATNPWIADSTVSRALFAGVCIGFSSAIAFKGYFSAGGMDIVSYYVSLKKSSNTGKYTVIINIIIMVLYCTVHIIGDPENWSNGLVGLFYSAVYLVVLAMVIDLVNVRNKKVQVQVITQIENLAEVLIANFPHGVTILKGIGAYSKQDRYVIWMAISSQEVKKVVRVVRATDPKAFVEVTNLQQVYGNFFIKPIR